jgi:hypothetical protein
MKTPLNNLPLQNQLKAILQIGHRRAISQVAAEIEDRYRQARIQRTEAAMRKYLELVAAK